MGPDKTKYDRDYVIDYTSPERNDIAEYNIGHTQWNGSKKVHDLSYLYNQDGERLEVNVNRYNSWSTEVVKYSLNIHEDIMGSSVCYTRQDSGYNANKHEYNIWGYNTKAPTYNYDPEYRATEPYYTGHPYDGSLNIYFAENRFYDAETGTWLSKDPARSGLNWYVYCESNPGTYVDVLGLVSTGNPIYFNLLNGSGNMITNSLVQVDKIIQSLKKYLSKGTFSEGLNISGTFGIFTVDGSIGYSVDSYSNIGIQYTGAWGVTASSNPAISLAKYVSITNSVQISNLNGEGGLIGASTAFFVPEIPVPLYIADDYATVGTLKNLPIQNDSGFTAYVGIAKQSFTGTLFELNMFEQWDKIYNHIKIEKTN